MAKPDETSIWKKEITLRRKPKQQAAPEPAKSAETSVWKKEITLRRKPKQQAAPEPAKQAETSIWKKEITLRRKPKAQPELLATPLFEPAPRPAPEPAAAPADEPTVPIALPPVTASVPEPAPADVTEAAAPPVIPVSAPQVEDTMPETQPTPVAVPPVPVSMPADEIAPDPSRAAFDAHVVATTTAVPADVPATTLTESEPDPVAPEPDAGAAAPEATAELPASRRDRREAKKAADQVAKRNRRRAKELAKVDRKASRHKQARVVGLKIGASQVAAAYVVNKGAPRLVRVARAPLPAGVVVGGELRDPEQLAAALKALFRKNKLPQTCVRLGIANNRIGVRTIEISGIDDEGQLANAVRFRAQEALPIPLDEAVLDYRILADTVDEQGVRNCRVLLVVAHRELVDRYVSACRKAGLKLIGIDLEAFGLLRAVANPAEEQKTDAAVVCLAIGHDRSTLAVSDGRFCEFTRVLAWGGSDLDVAVARTLDLTPAAAEPLKRELVLGETGEAAGLDAAQADEARAAMATELRSFARELVGSLRFYQEQPNSLGIGEIMISGGASATAGLAGELGRLIGIPVRVADPLARIRVPRKLKSLNGSTGSLAVAVGLGIEE
jgi:type IV pilus assembly protein PilM